MKNILTFLIILFFSFNSNSQDKNLIRIGVRLFKEADAPFSFKRKFDKSQYVYNLGFGLRAKYLRILKNRISAGVETGAWYFINNSKNIDSYNDEYKTRNLVTPFMGVIHITVYRKDLNWVDIGLKGGSAYLQNIHKLNDKSVRVATKWSSLFEVSLTAQIVTKRKSMRTYHIGYGCDFFDNKVIRSAYFDFRHIRF